MEELKRLIDTAAGRKPADLVIRGAKIADVFSGEFVEGDVAVAGGKIAGICVDGSAGGFDGKEIINARGKYLLPALIDSHIHVESSFLAPFELARALAPHGTGTIITDPHEIVNVCGKAGLKLMLDSARNAPVDIFFMLPSCVPVTSLESSGAVFGVEDMAEFLNDERVLGLGEMMDYRAVIAGDENVLRKIAAVRAAGKPVDGHSPGVSGGDLSAYAAAGILTDHECDTVEALNERVGRGMYVLLRQGSACRDLAKMLPAVNERNSRRLAFCSDDRQPHTIAEKGHITEHLRMCVAAGIDAMTAIRMATLNAAECYRLYDRGAVAPGYRADLILTGDLEQFNVEKTWHGGILVAENGRCLVPPQALNEALSRPARSSMHVAGFDSESLKLPLASERVFVIDVRAGTVVTGKGKATVRRGKDGCFAYDPGADIVKIAVVERHKGSGRVGLALMRGYGLNAGAIAVSVAHDSHNIICAFVNDADGEKAVRTLIDSGGGVALVKDGRVVADLPLPLAGLMSDRDAAFVAGRIAAIEKAAAASGIKPGIDPLITLAFMSLIVIPSLKVTDRGLFDVEKFEFISCGRE